MLAWMRAFAEVGLDPGFYAHRERPLDEVLPWEVISTGVRKDFLARELARSRQGVTLDDCRARCFACGILAAFGDDWSDAWRCPTGEPAPAHGA
jgi:hypothetical protein